MRLKFLFFPIIIVISVSIFIGYIWPEIDALKAANEEKIKNEADLQAVKDKQAAIQKIDAQIKGDSENEKMISEYLPSQKVEERILSGVNFLAADSGVSLVNISLKSIEPDAASTAEQIATLSAAPLATTNAADTLPIGSEQAASNQIVVAGIQLTEAAISVTGDYDKVRLFLDQMEKFPVLNFVKSLDISKQELPASVASSEDAEVKAEDPGILSVNLVVDFGWMNPVQVDNQKIAKVKTGLDSNAISAVRQYISQKAPTADRFGDNNGKRNPFLP